MSILELSVAAFKSETLARYSLKHWLFNISLTTNFHTTSHLPFQDTDDTTATPTHYEHLGHNYADEKFTIVSAN